MAETETIAQTVHNAVKDRRLLCLDYQQFQRVVQPRRIDTDPAGHVVLVAFQLSGGCATGPAFGLKHFRIDQIDSASLLVEGA